MTITRTTIKMRSQLAIIILYFLILTLVRAQINPDNNQDETTKQQPHRITIVASKYLKPQSDYYVLINLANSEQAASIDLSITGARDSNREQQINKSLVIQSGETQTIKFSISNDWPSAEYILSVQAEAVDKSWKFSQEAQLEYKLINNFKTLIQTDKAIYKPGELVQFRVLFLTLKTLTPYILKTNEELVNVTIIDPKKNLIKSWQGLSNYRGLLSLNLKLSEDPMLGDYTINIESLNSINNQLVSSKKQFTVAEYILPTFDVDIQLANNNNNNNYVTYNESNIITTVKATYTYGKPVQGHVILTVQPLIRFQQIDIGGRPPIKQSQYRARLIDGKADINLDVVKNLKDNSEINEQDHLFEREIEFFALVEEDFTGRVYNKTKIVKLYDRKIKIESLKSNEKETFKPGLKYKLLFKVAYQDDTPVEDNGQEVELRLGSLGYPWEIVKLQPYKGIIEHTIDVPRKIKASPKLKPDVLITPDFIELQAIYKKQIYYLNPIRKFNSLSDEYMQISLPQLSENNNNRFRLANRKNQNQNVVNIGDNLKVKVTSTEGMQQVTCQGLSSSGGDIIWALSRDAKNEKEFEFEIKVDQKMVPEAKVLCFYIRPDNKEMITDLYNIKVNDNLNNKNLVKLTANRDEAKPGQEIEIDVLTKPNSLVGLLAIDQSVLLLKGGNDISQQDLIKINNDHSSNSKFKTGEGELSYRKDAFSLFEDANLIVLTNNIVHRELPLYSMYSSKKDLLLNNYNQGSSRIILNSLPLESNQQFSPPEFHLNNKDNDNQIIIRSNFPETWLWENGTANLDGLFKIKSKIPDTITSWILSAFSMNENFGIGLTQTKTSIRVFKPFFIKLNLPYSIIRGEIVNIQAVIFNYSKRPTSAKVIVDNSKGDYEFVETTNNIDDDDKTTSTSDNNQNQKQMTFQLNRIPAENGSPISFLIKPKRTGSIDIKLIATSEFASDGLNQKLLVKPEGQTQHLNKAMLINLSPQSNTFNRNISIDVPKNSVVLDSQKVFVSIVGDIMGAGLSNVDDLLRLPYGCGEQNMINLVPNMVIFNYLKNTRRIKEAQRLRAIRNIETGYQRQLNYKRSDGSFSAFGDNDKNGSVWLTAYVLKTFQQIKSIITVDEKVIRRAANFIAHQSRSDGSIEEIGMLHNKELASASSLTGSSYLTAYSMISLLQTTIKPDDEAPSPIGIDEVLEKGLNYLEQHLDESISIADENPYDLSIITYTLHLANRNRLPMDKAYDQLWSKAKEEPELGVWWEAGAKKKDTEEVFGKDLEKSGNLEIEGGGPDFESINTTPQKKKQQQQPPLIPIQVDKKQSEHLFIPDSLSIEMTSFALMSTVLRGDLERALPIVKWLISQQNSNGGFASTQDTVLAIEALALFANANLASKSPLSIDIELLYPKPADKNQQQSLNFIRRNNIDQFLISNTNALVNQQTRLPDNTSWVQIKASGSGSAVVQVSWQYNLLVSAEKPAFYLNPILDKTSNTNYIQLSVCTFYKAGEQSNMAVMEVELPSGYMADVEALPGLMNIKDVKRIDTANGDSKVIIYLDKVTRENELCVTIPAHRTIKVINNKPVPVSIYDYYNRQQVARIFYTPPPTSWCDICDDLNDNCKETCSKQKSNERLLLSLHEQRKKKEPMKYANLTISPTDNNSKNNSNQLSTNAYQLLPLAPIFVSMVSAIKNLQ